MSANSVYTDDKIIDEILGTKTRLLNLVQKFEIYCDNLQVPIPFVRFLYSEESLPISCVCEILENKIVEFQEDTNRRREQIASVNYNYGEIARICGSQRISSMSFGPPLPTLVQIEECKERCNAELAERIAQFRNRLEFLWGKLGTDLTEQSRFNIENNNLNLKTLISLNYETARLEVILEDVVTSIKKLRSELKELWRKIHRVEHDDRFHFFDSHVYSENLRIQIQVEIDKCNSYYVKNEELFKSLQKFDDLWQQYVTLQIYSNSGSKERYQNRRGILLNEEKLRNRLNKMIPEFQTDLINRAISYANREGVEFFTFGRTIEEYIQHLKDSLKKSVEETKSRAKEGVGPRSHQEIN